mmetsp:Transcript_69775/g.182973  ORF Transcript_69775/g.182973 Transcript_69775/m.182973 type:complete len:208 (+) Transcript_69775:396-1019(+)
MHVQVAHGENLPPQHKEEQTGQHDQRRDRRVGHANHQHQEQRGAIQGQVRRIQEVLRAHRAGLRRVHEAEVLRQPLPEFVIGRGERHAQEGGQAQQAYGPDNQCRGQHGDKEEDPDLGDALSQLPQDRAGVPLDCLQGVGERAGQDRHAHGGQLEAPVPLHRQHLEGAPGLDPLVVPRQLLQHDRQDLEKDEQGQHGHVEREQRVEV